MLPEIKRKSKGPMVKLLQTFLKAQGFDAVEPDGDFGKNTENAVKKFQSDNGLDADGEVGENTWKAAIAAGLKMLEESSPSAETTSAETASTETASTETSSAETASTETVSTENTSGADGSSIDLSADQLKTIMTGIKNTDVETFIEPLKRVLEKYEINTPLRIAHFLAQVGHESGSFRYKQELASGAAYEGRRDLGNTQPGDGRKFKGHGLIQITGRANHQSYADYVGDPDLMEHPERMGSEPDHSAGAAGWFWMTRKLNAIADRDDVLTITKRINGGTNGLQDRKDYLARAKRVLGI